MSVHLDYQPTSLAPPMSLPELEANVTRIDAEIAQLQAERLKVYKSWRVRKASIAPFTRLPIEIIRQIFLECSDTVTASHIGHGNRLPLRLLRVCRAWERIAASIEHLWTEMQIDVGSTNAMPILASCLKRSGKLPLDITLCVSAECPDENEMEQKALSLMLEHLHRWRHINIIWEGNCFNPNFAAGNAFSAPMLETLHLETQAIDDSSLDYQVAKDLATITANAPRLQSFIWETQASSEIEPPLDLWLPWAQLVTLDLSCFLSVEQYIRILKECARVETCRLPLLRIYSEMDPNPNIPTSLDNLHTLHINSDLPLNAFFDSFAFPALRIISISNIPNEYEEHREFEAPDWTQSSFLNLLQRSKAPLEYLRLAVTMSESDLIECLTCVGGTLQLLAVKSVDQIPFLTGETARFMSHHIDAGVVTCTCPKLEQIHFGRSVVMPLANDVLGNLAESRWSDDGHLSHRQWCSPNLTAFRWEVAQGVVPPADIRWLAKLKQAGMPISSGYLHDLFNS